MTIKYFYFQLNLACPPLPTHPSPQITTELILNITILFTLFDKAKCGWVMDKTVTQSLDYPFALFCLFIIIFALF